MTKKELETIRTQAEDIANGEGSSDEAKLLNLSIQLQAEMLVQMSKLRRQSMSEVIDAMGMLGNVVADVIDRIEGKLAITNYVIDEEDESDDEEDLRPDGGNDG